MRMQLACVFNAQPVQRYTIPFASVTGSIILPVTCLGVGLGGFVPFQRGLVPHQFPRYAISNSNKAVTVIGEVHLVV